MTDVRPVNQPLEVYTSGDVVYQVLAKLPKREGEHEMWLVSVSSPRDLELEPQEVFAESFLEHEPAWREGNGPLPEGYVFEVPEDGEQDDEQETPSAG